MTTKIAFTIFILTVALGLITGTSSASTVPAGTGPWAVAVNPVTNRAYVANYAIYPAQVTVIDGATTTPTNITSGRSPAAVAVNPVTNKSYVANFNSSSVTVIDGATNATKTVPVGSGPGAVAVNPETNRVYVGNYKDRSVTVIDGATDTVVDTVLFANRAVTATGQTPSICLSVNPVTNRIYATDYFDNSVSVIDGTVTYGPATYPARVLVGTYPSGVAVNPVTNRAYVTNYSDATVTVIDGANNPVVTIPVVITPRAVAVNPVTNRIYVVNYNLAGMVSVIDGATNSVTNVSTGTNSVALTVDPVRNTVAVANEFGNNVTVIDGGNVLGTPVAAGTRPVAVATDLLTGALYVANNGSNDVTIIAGTPATSPLNTTITPFPNNTTASQTPTLNMTATSTTALPVRRVYYQVDGTSGAWLAAASGGGSSFSATVGPLSQGSHTIHAFATDGTDATSINTGVQSSPLVGEIASYTFTVTGVAPTTPSVTLTSGTNPSIYGATVSFTATLMPATATGSVTFKDGSTVLGTGTITGGVATFSTAALTAGSYSITAVYGGDGSYNGATSTPLSQTVTRATPTVTTWPTAAAITYGQALSASTLSGGTASVPGSFAFTDPNLKPAVGTAGQNVTFSPNDGSNYATLSGTVSVTVGKATPTVGISSDANPSIYGDTVTFNATVSPATVTGSVTFKDGSTVLGTGTLSGGVATYSTAALAAGSHSITAVYGGDSSYNSATSAALSQIVTKATPTVTAWPTATAITYGQTLTLSTLTGGTATPSGTFAWTTPATAPTTGTASYSVTFTPTDATNYTSVSGTVSVTVGKATPTVALTSGTNPAVYGDSVIFTATLAPATVTGSVTFKDGSTVLGTGTLSGGVATYSTSTLTAGSHSITAVYGGDSSYNGATSAALTQTVTRATTTITLSSGTNPSTYGVNVTFIVAISPATATGSVTFKDGSSVLGTGTVSGGIATYSTAALTTGSHSITAVYGGDSNYSSATSAALSQTVTKATPAVLNWPTASPLTYGQALSDSTLSGGTASVPGSFAFTDSTLKPAVGTAGQGVTFTPTDSSNYTTVSGTVSVTVTKASSVVALTSGTNLSTFGDSMTFTATLTPATASGSVTFREGNTVLGTGTITGGVATFSTSTLTAGSHSITAVYSGDSSYNGATSAALTQTVTKATPTVTTWPTASSLTYGQTLSTAILSGGIASVPGSFAFTSPTLKPAVGTANQGVTFTPTDSSSYAAVSGAVSVTVTKATPALTTWPAASPLTYGQALSNSTLSGGTASVPGSFAFTDPTLKPAVGTASQSITFTPTDSSNYTTVSGTVSVTVAKATPTVALTSGLNPSTYGDTVIFTATVSPATATGSVTFKDGSTVLGTGTLSGGVATFSTSTLTAGSHSTTALYNGDSSYNSATSAALSQTVTRATTTVTLSSGTNPSTYGDNVTFIVAISPATATGSVTFKDGSTTLASGTISSGQATLTTNLISAGSHTITAVYGGDGNYIGVTSNAITQTVTRATPTVTAWPTAAAITYGQPLSDSTLSGGTASVPGSFAFTDPTLKPAVGTAGQNVTFTPNDGSNYATVSGTASVTVSKATPAVALTSGLNPSTYGDSVTFTATISPATVTGSVTFKDGSTVLGTGTLSSGVATYSTAALTTGSHSITAVYGGDGSYTGATSTPLSQTVTRATPTVTAWPTATAITYGQALSASTLGGGTASVPGGFAFTDPTLKPAVGTAGQNVTFTPTDGSNYTTVSGTVSVTVGKATPTVSISSGTNPSTYGDNATFTATISPATVTGSVTFKDGSTVLGSGTLSGGVATYSTSSLTAGSHSITADYGGDSNYHGATATAITQTVTRATPTVTAWPAASAITYGQPLSDSTLSGGSASVPGSFAFTDPTQKPAVGTAGQSLTFTPSDGSNYTTLSGMVSITVGMATPTISISTGTNPSTYGDTVSFTVTVTPATATGSVTFQEGSTDLGSGTLSGGTATFTTSALSAGSHSITALYSGDTNYRSVTSSVITQTVARIDPGVTIMTSQNPSDLGDGITLSVTVTPATATGSVTFMDGGTVLATDAVTGGQATLSTTALTAGSHTITALYSGDSIYNAATSMPLTQTVNLVKRILVTSTANYFGTVADAYADAGSSDSIQAQAVSLIEPNLNFNQPKNISFKGGYDRLFADQTGYTTLEGVVSISQGTVIVDRIIIR